jgi:hypothetical protein
MHSLGFASIGTFHMIWWVAGFLTSKSRQRGEVGCMASTGIVWTVSSRSSFSLLDLFFARNSMASSINTIIFEESLPCFLQRSADGSIAVGIQ